MFLNKDVASLLAQLGFTETQANLYFTLLRSGKTDAKTLAANSRIPRTAVYRTLDELQRKGLVEKEIAAPFKFKAVPPNLGLQNSITRKFDEYKDLEKKTKEFLLSFPDIEEDTSQHQDYRITILDGRERIIQKMKEDNDNAKYSADIISSLPRYLQILNHCFETIEEALNRGVKYRLILGVPDREFSLSVAARSLLMKPNFEMKTHLGYLDINSAVFDGREVAFNFYPSTPPGESPIIVTNHPSFLLIYQGYFDAKWKSPDTSQFLLKQEV